MGKRDFKKHQYNLHTSGALKAETRKAILMEKTSKGEEEVG